MNFFRKEVEANILMQCSSAIFVSNADFFSEPMIGCEKKGSDSIGQVMYGLGDPYLIAVCSKSTSLSGFRDSKNLVFSFLGH